MGNYLVTGGAGFIGSCVARSLLGDGHDVIVIDNLSTGTREAVPNGADLIVGHCQDPSSYGRLRRSSFDAIYHIAGQSSGEISFDDPVYDLQSNTQSTLLLLKLALETGCPKLLFASSMSVYGDDGEWPVDEDAGTRPKSFYGVGKLASEHYLRIYEQRGVTGIGLRLFNVYGPWQNLENLRQGMVSIFLAQALNDRHIHVKGGADRFRDFVYIDDVVRAFRMLEHKAQGHAVYNVATGVKTRVGELVAGIQAALPYKTTVRYEGSTPGDQHGIVGDSSRIRSAVGWSPEVRMCDGLVRMVDWALGRDSGSVG